MDLFQNFLEVFIVDFVVFNKVETHLVCLRKTFERCRETNLKLHLGKCLFGMLLEVLLGQIILKDGLHVDMDMVKAISK